jgi:phage-related protein
MALVIKLHQDLPLRQQLVMTPQLQEAVKKLQLSLPELETIERSELDANPLLEQFDQDMAEDERPIVWVGSSKEDLKSFPEEVRGQIGYALAVAQEGGEHPDAKPLKVFVGADLFEVVEDFDGDSYRAIYTVQFEEAIYVLHAFHERSKSGSGISQREVTQISERLKRAEELHVQRIVKRGKH